MPRSHITFAAIMSAWTLAATSTQADTATTEVDLLIVHTSAVTTNQGSSAGVESLAMASVTSVNDAMEASSIPVRYNLIAVEEVTYTESSTSLSEDLEAIAGQSDPINPAHAEVLNLRDTYGADLVTLFRDGAAGGAAGLAYILTPSSDSEDFGYAVVSDASALSNLTLAHELGHNMASAHARGEAGNAPPLDEARGYTFSANGTDYRTIMSIDSSFSRISHYSNPGVSYEGAPTGVPAGDPNAADNASAFVVSTPVIAGFRRTQTEAPSFLEEPVGDTLVAGGDARLRALLRGLPTLSVQWYQGEVGDTSQPLNSTESELERGGTESIVDLGSISTTTAFWLRVSNPNGTLDSRTFRVVLVPAPSGTSPLVEQAVDDGSLIVSFAFEQEMTVPDPAYLNTLTLNLRKQGSPPNPTVRFEEVGGAVIFEQELDAAQIDSFPADPVDFPIGRFVAPGSQLRVTVTPGEGQDSQNRIIWDYAQPGNVTAPNVGESNLVSDRRLMFALSGTQAWTYHTWLDAANPPAESTNLQPADPNGGLPNLIRYALGGDFDSPASELRPEALPLDSGEAPFRYTRRPDLVDVEFIVEHSSDLETWTAVDSSDITELAPTPEGDDAYEARVTFDGSPLFLRISTEHPPAP